MFFVNVVLRLSLFYTGVMKFVKQVEAMLKSGYVLAVAAGISFIGAMFSPRRLTDQSHEIVQAGTKWIDGSILYVQSWSSHSPQTVFLGYVYGRYFRSNLMQTVFEIALWASVALLMYGISRILFNKTPALRNSLLLLTSSTIFVPRIWQHGVTDQKLSLLFLAMFIYGYLVWKQSGKTMWLFGSTSKNWRFILLSGIAFTMLVYTSWVYVLTTIPIFIDLIGHKKWRKTEMIQWVSFYIVPFILETWVWLSHLSSHRLLSLHFYAELLGVRQSVRINEPLSLVLPAVIIAILFIMALLTNVRGVLARRNTVMWAWALVSIILIVLWPAWLIANITVALPLLIYVLPQQLKRPDVIAAVSLTMVFLSLPLRLLDSRQTKLQMAQADLASAYIEQRSIDSDTVIYYGKGAGFFSEYSYTNPTRYYDLSALAYDNDHLSIEPSFRGDAEAVTPLFAVIATTNELQAPATPRLDQYFTKHYEKVADLDGYQILKRK